MVAGVKEHASGPRRMVRWVLVAAMAMVVFIPAAAAAEVIGVIMPGDTSYFREIHGTFTAALQRGGDAGTEIIVQKPYPDPISLSNAARKLIALEADVIIAYGAPATLAVIGERTKIPVVYAAVYDPLVPKMKSKNITGISAKASVSSLLRYLRSTTGIATLGVVYSAAEEDSVYQMRELHRLSEQYGFRIEGIDIKRVPEARAALTGRKVDALFITGGSIATLVLPAVTDFAREHRIPTASLLPDRTHPAIITLTASPREQGERLADMVRKVLAGTPAERIRPEASNDTELVFNLREARALGLRIPMELVTEATRLIQ